MIIIVVDTIDRLRPIRVKWLCREWN